MVYTDGIMALSEPEYGDDADIAVINSNSVKIDDHMTNAFNNLAEPFNPNKAYEVGEIVVYEKVTYIFIVAKSAGAWDATKVEVKPLGTAIFEKEGGAGSLSDLTDTDIDTPAEGEVLTWDGEKWVNAEGTPSVTKTVTGNPIEISDGADAPLVKCTTAITGSQDLHGYDKPWVGGAGKNKVDVSNTTLSGAEYLVPQNTPINLSSGTYTLSFNCSNAATSSAFRVMLKDGETVIANPLTNLVSGLNQITFTLNTNADNWYLYINNNAEASYTNIMLERGSTATSFEPYSNICPITAYTEVEIEVRGKNLLDDTYKTSNVNNVYFYLLSDGLMLDAGTYTISCDTSLSGIYVKSKSDNTELFVAYGKSKLTFTLSEKRAVCFILYKNNGISGVSDFMLEKNSDATSYEPYKGVIHTATFTNSIYRGSEDVVNGEVRSDVYVIDLADITEWSTVTYESHQIVRTRIEDINYLGAKTLISSHLSPATNNNTYENGTFRNKVGNYYNFEVMIDGITTQADMNAWTAAQRTAGTPVQLTIDLQNSTTSSVTPTNLPIKSLFGYNHIESSTGEMEVEYITENYQPLVDLIQNSKHVYSTQEQVVGKWVDGKDVYEKTYTFSSLPAVSDWTAFDEDCEIDTLVDYSCMYTRSNGQTDNNSDLLRVAYNPPNALGDLCYYPGGVGATHITVRYTKATATTRNLSKGTTDGLKAEISEVKDEGEEILKGDEKALKIDESEDTETKETDETEGNADEVQNETVTE